MLKKMANIILVLFFIYILVQIIYNFFINGHDRLYNIIVDKQTYNVREVFSQKHITADETIPDNNNYYYEIKKQNKDNILFSFSLIGDYTGKKEYLEEIKLYQDDDLICMYPIFKDHNNQLDVICYQNEEQFFYRNIKQNNNGLDIFIDSLKDLGYNHYSWNDSLIEPSKEYTINIYDDNILDNLFIGIWNYKGIYKIDVERNINLQLLDDDQYDNYLCTMVDKYYVFADYNQDNEFNRFIMIDLTSTKANNINLSKSISYNSFIQGVVEDYIYIVDESNKKQYKISIYDKNLILMGDPENKGRYYNNGIWEERSIFDIIDNKLIFTDEIIIPNELIKYNINQIDEVMGDTDGYYYLYIDQGNTINVYRIDKQNLNIRTLLFSIPSISNITYIDDYIFFISNDTLYMYQDKLGLRPLVNNNEFTFNKNNM